MTGFVSVFFGAGRFKRLCASLTLESSSLSKASCLLRSIGISLDLKYIGVVPESGPFVAVVPVRSGILEVAAAMSALIDHAGRKDVKVLSDSKGMPLLALLGDNLLSRDSDYGSLSAAVKCLESGGGVVYFVRDHMLQIPYRLSVLSRAEFIAIMVRPEDSSMWDWTRSASKWCCDTYIFRRFFSNERSTSYVELSLLSDPEDALEVFSKFFDGKF